MKREIIPVVVGALEVINKGSEELVREIPGNINNNNNTNNNNSSSRSGSSSNLVRNTNKCIVLFTVSCSRFSCTRSSSIALWSSNHHPKLIFCLLPQPINSCTFSWCFDFHWVIFVLLHFPEVYGVIRNYAIPGLGRNRLPFQKNAGAVYCFCTIQFRSSWRYCTGFRGLLMSGGLDRSNRDLRTEQGSPPCYINTTTTYCKKTRHEPAR